MNDGVLVYLNCGGTISLSVLGNLYGRMETKDLEAAIQALSSHKKAWKFVEAFSHELLRGSYTDSYDVANQTAEVLKVVAVATCMGGLKNVRRSLRAVGRYLAGLGGKYTYVIGNVTRRVLKLVQETLDDPDEEFSIQENIKEALSLFLDEFNQTRDTMVTNAAVAEQIHSAEVILTFGRSATVERLLLEAAKKRTFEVVIAENSPRGDGHGLAKVLASEAKLDVTLIPDSAIFAVMPRVHKVIIGAEAVLANGSLIAPAGTLLVTTVARHYSKPVVSCAELYKVTPLFPLSTMADSKLLHPATILNEEIALEIPNVNIVNPANDLVPAEMISLLLSDNGGCSPVVVHRLVKQLYDEVEVPL